MVLILDFEIVFFDPRIPLVTARENATKPLAYIMIMLCMVIVIALDRLLFIPKTIKIRGNPGLMPVLIWRM